MNPLVRRGFLGQAGLAGILLLHCSRIPAARWPDMLIVMTD